MMREKLKYSARNRHFHRRLEAYFIMGLGLYFAFSASHRSFPARFIGPLGTVYSGPKIELKSEIRVPAEAESSIVVFDKAKVRHIRQMMTSGEIDTLTSLEQEYSAASLELDRLFQLLHSPSANAKIERNFYDAMARVKTLGDEIAVLELVMTAKYGNRAAQFALQEASSRDLQGGLSCGAGF